MVGFPVLSMPVCLQNLTVRYGSKAALCMVSAQLEPGQWVLCTGDSGSGKSTLADVICGTLPAKAIVEGSITTSGRRIAKIWQEPSATFSPYRTITEQIRDVLRATGQLPSLAQSLLDQVGLASHASSFPRQMSSGQIQRAAIARALATQPDLLVADEATASLDGETERDIVALLNALRRKHGFGILWLSHLPAAVLPYATEHWHIEQGSLQRVAGTKPSEGPSLAPGPVLDRPASELLLEAKHLSKAYGSPVFEGISLRLYQGRTLALIGRSGSGKSTLARLLAGHEEADSGAVHRHAPAQLILPDAYRALNPHWKVGEAVAEALRIQGVSSAIRQQRAKEMLNRLALDDIDLERPVSTLSGGQRRRLLVARALLCEAKILIFDEATNGLDAELRTSFLALLRKLQQELGLAYLWITHDYTSLPAFADEVVTLLHGSLQEMNYGANLPA
ncbi:MAG: ABC transporter ATP-binding protein [Bryobacter sp.]